MKRYLLGIAAAAVIGLGAWAAWLGAVATTTTASTEPATRAVTVTVPHGSGFTDVTFTVPQEQAYGSKFLVPVSVSPGVGSAPQSLDVSWQFRQTGNSRIYSGSWSLTLADSKTGQFEVLGYPVGVSRLVMTVRLDSQTGHEVETAMKVRHSSAEGEWRYLNPRHVSRIDVDHNDGTVTYYWAGSGQVVSRKLSEHENLSGSYHHNNSKDGDHLSETVEDRFFGWQHVRP